MFTPQSSWEPKDWYPSLQTAKIIALDIESKDPELLTKGPGFARQNAHVIGVSIATDHGIKGYWPVRHEGGDNLDLEKVFGWLRTELRTDIPKVGANILYDLEGLTAEGIFVGGTKIDVQVAEALLDETLYSYKLDVLAERYLGVKKDETLLRQAAESLGLDPKSEMYKLPARFVGLYAEADADLTLRIWQAQEPKIAQEDLSRVFELECRLIECLLQMRFNGVPVDLDKADQARTLILQKRDDIAKRIKDICGFEVQVMAPRSVAAALSTQNIEYGKTLLGNPTFPADWLDNHEAELCRLIVQQRRYEKAVGTFIDNMIFDMVSPKGRLHTSYRSTKMDDGGTKSGRLASTKPGLQLVPARDPELGPMIRKLFVPEPGYQWGCFDYCFDDQTEVLTNQGWKLFSALDKTELVAQYCPESQTLSYAKPLEYQAFDWKNKPLHRIHGRFVDLVVSPNHNCLLFKACDVNRPEIIKAFEYPSQYYGQLNAAKYVDVAAQKLSEDQLSLIMAIQADAYVEPARITFSLKKQRKVLRLTEVLGRLSIEYSKSRPPSKPGFYTIRFSRSAVDQLLPYLDLTTKTFTRALVQLNFANREFILKESQFWDGSQIGSYYSSCNIDNVDILQEIATITGVRTTKNTRTTMSGKLFGHLSYSVKEPITWVNTFERDKVKYTGKIYCVTMPLSTVVVRRNGKVCITGQSQQEPRVTVHYARLMADFLKGQVTQSDRDGQSRLAAMLSADEAVRMYQENPDIDYHQMIADMANISRKPAKTLNLGAAYGMGKAKMMRQLGVDMQAAVEIYEKYHLAVPYVKQLGNECMQLAQQRGWVKTLLGRKRRYKLWEPRYSEKGSRPMPLPREQAVAKWGEANIKRAMTHNALNAIVQGSSADMIKTAMVLCHEQKLGIMHLTVHDELDFSVMPDDVPKIKEIMEHAMSLVVPLKVDVELGPSWGDAK